MKTDSFFASSVGKQTAAVSATVNNTPVPPTVDWYTSNCQSQHIGQGVTQVSTDILTNSVHRQSIQSNNTLTNTRSSLSRHIRQVSVDISVDFRSPYWRIVLTDTLSTDASSTHDPEQNDRQTLDEDWNSILISIKLPHNKAKYKLKLNKNY